MSVIDCQQYLDRSLIGFYYIQIDPVNAFDYLISNQCGEAFDQKYYHFMFQSGVIGFAVLRKPRVQ